MLNHPGDSESVPDIELNILPTEDLSFARDASRSFSGRKNPYGEVRFDTENTGTQMTETNLFASKKTASFTSKPRQPLGEELSSIIPMISPIGGQIMKATSIWQTRGQDEKSSQIKLEDIELTNKRKVSNLTTKAEEEDLDIFENKAHKSHQHDSRKARIERLLESVAFNIFVGIFTIFALFANDTGTLIGSRVVDMVIDIIGVLSFFVFAAELVLAFIVEKSYRWSLYFWLDLLSTLSVTFHIEFLLEDFFPETLSHSGEIAEVSRASRLIAKEGKIIRLIQVIQINRLYKQINKAQTLREMKLRQETLKRAYSQLLSGQASAENEDHPKPSVSKIRSLLSFTSKRPAPVEKDCSLDENMQKDRDIKKRAETLAANYRIIKKGRDKETKNTFREIEEESVGELRIGKKLSDSTMRRTVIVVVALLLVLPLFDSNFYIIEDKSHKYQLSLLRELVDDKNVTEAARKQAIKFFIEDHTQNMPYLVYLKIGKNVTFSDNSVDVQHMRHSQSETMVVITEEKGEITAIISLEHKAKFEAGLGILNTIFVCFILTFTAILMNFQINKLLIQPLESIIFKVNKILRNPSITREPHLIKVRDRGLRHTAHLVENAIIRMSRLLTIGFGDIGTSIVIQNFLVSGNLNAYHNGKKRAAIFGKCDIHNFIQTTEALQEETSIFINVIADIVHSMTDKYTGTVSQNMGDAFFLVWLIPEEFVVNRGGEGVGVISNQKTQNIADCALICFMKAYARINRDPTLLGYKNNPQLNGYKIDLGFGLHVGWAIEGTIGSEYKVDSHYLSTDVLLTSKLEAGTREYNVPLLFSGEMYKMLSDEMRQKSRLIDVVVPHGSERSHKIYTVDMDTDGLGVAKNRMDMPKNEREERQKKKKEYLKNIVETGYSYTLLYTDKDLKHLLKNKNLEFNNSFDSGIKCYMNKNWMTTKEKFEDCLKIKDDGPTKSLLKFMEKYGFMAPEHWGGREIVLKK